MLVLQQAEGCFIAIRNRETGERIDVKVLELKRNTVRLGFTAPIGYEIMREQIMPTSWRESPQSDERDPSTG